MKKIQIDIAPNELPEEHFEQIMDLLKSGKYGIFGWVTRLIGHIHWQKKEIENLRKAGKEALKYMHHDSCEMTRASMAFDSLRYLVEKK